MKKDPGYVMTARKLARQYFASLRKTRDDLAYRVKRMPRPSPERAALLKRIRTIHASLGLETNFEPMEQPQ